VVVAHEAADAAGEVAERLGHTRHGATTRPAEAWTRCGEAPDMVAVGWYHRACEYLAFRPKTREEGEALPPAPLFTWEVSTALEKETWYLRAEDGPPV